VENEQGEQFGKERIKSLIEAYQEFPAQKIIQKITDQITMFRGNHSLEDDITLAIVKTW
jgi:sigma-B regulation protein RsbU (phosphoserine phosphatase)